MVHTVWITWTDLVQSGPAILSAIDPPSSSRQNPLDGVQRIRVSEELSICVCEQTANVCQLVKYLQQEEVDRVLVSGAVWFMTSEESVMSMNLNDLYQGELKFPKLAGETRVEDAFLIGILHFMKVAGIPARLLLLRGHKSSFYSKNAAKNEVLALITAVMKELDMEIAFDAKKLSEFAENNSAVEKSDRKQFLMYG
jgi:DUF1009 family protein